MLLRRVRLSAFRQFAAADIELGPGITLITGPNGAGKSTLLEAVVWVLFGAGAVRRSAQTLPTLFVDGPTLAQIDIELDGRLHTLARTLGDDELDHEERPHGLDLPARETFMRACFTGRRELQALAQLDPAGRMDALARILGTASRAHARASKDSILGTALRTLDEELASAERRLAALESAPDLLTQYGTELAQATTELAEAEQHAARLHDEWAQKRQDVQTRLDAYRRRGEELKRQIERLSAAGANGACPTCDQALGSGIDRVVGRLDDEFYITAQDVKWLVQRHAQLERRPPDVAEADTRRERLRALVSDRAERVARCEQAVQELWSVAQEKQRAQESLAELHARLPAQLPSADVAAVSAVAGEIVSRVSDCDGGLELTEDGRVYGVRGKARVSVLSGADEDLFAFALRLAAARIAAARAGLASLLLLDEPFGALDATRRVALFAALRALQPPARQILITTQDASLAQQADRCIEVRRDAHGGAHIG